MVLLGPSDGRFGQAMVPFLHGQRMVPARAEPVLVTVTENQSSRHRVRLEEDAKSNSVVRPRWAAGSQFWPLDASQTRSSGQFMVAIDGPGQKIPTRTGLILINSGQFMVPNAANSWSF